MSIPPGAGVHTGEELVCGPVFIGISHSIADCQIWFTRSAFDVCGLWV
jgi:hypothetical protein